MITTRLVHPDVLAALAGAGHGAVIAIVDANFPVSTHRGRNASIVRLNLARGCLDAVTVADAIAEAVPVERACVMQPAVKGPYAVTDDPEIWDDFRRVLGAHDYHGCLDPVGREAFYRLVASDDTALIVATGEERLYGNLLLRIGVVMGGLCVPTPPAPGAASRRS